MGKRGVGGAQHAFRCIDSFMTAQAAMQGARCGEQKKHEAALVFLHQAVKAEAGAMDGSRHNHTLGELLIELGHLGEACHFLKVPLQSSSVMHQSMTGKSM